MDFSHFDQQWNITVYEQGHFEKFFRDLDEIDQAIVGAAIEHVLKPLGTEICSTEWGKNLKKGLYEFRIRRDLATILREFGPPDAADSVPSKHRNRKLVIRVYCTFHGDRAILLLGGYDKMRKGAGRQEQKEIMRARKALQEWKNNG